VVVDGADPALNQPRSDRDLQRAEVLG
jgi:hypothetical protein